jgi:hypothetical protein
MHPPVLSSRFQSSGVFTELEFKGPWQEEQQQPTPEVQEVQPAGEAPDKVVVDCHDYVPCNFMKGKPRSIISLLISKNANKYYVIYIVALRDRCWVKTLTAYVPYPCLESIP